ncbi:MAG TPA: hypothetical protein VH593_12985, partial [Ktedonobacteraceae bacterium]
SIRGRVIGAITAVAFLAIPLGTLITGYLLDFIGIKPTLLAEAFCDLVVTSSLLFIPHLREMDTVTAVKS